MLSVLKLSRRARWAVPVGALVVTGAVMAGSPGAAAADPGPAARGGRRGPGARADRDGARDRLARPARAARHRQPHLDSRAADRVAHHPGVVREPAALPAGGTPVPERDRRGA